MEYDKYWIHEDYFIFKPEFNNELDDFINLIVNYKKLIFSDYNDYKICIVTNNKFEEKNNYKGSKFNKALDNTFENLINLQQLTFGLWFNQPLTNSLEKLINLQQLTFGHYFNLPLANSLEKLINLQQLTFGFYFNQPLANSLDKLINLQQLTFGTWFNQPLENSLEKLINLQQLIFCCYFNQVLANSLEKLINLRVLTFGSEFNQSLGNSLDKLINLQQLTFSWCFNQPLANSLDKLINLQQLTLGHEFKQKLEIPFNIRILNLNCNNQYIIDNLPNSIEELELGIYFNLKLDDLPSSMRIIRIENEKYDRELNNLPKFLKKIILPTEYIKEIKNINPECIIEKIDFLNTY